MSINVTRTFLPPFDEYTTQLKRAWDKGWITNNGELVRELEQKLKEYLGVKHLLFCSNGTTALQIAIKALNITGEIITTPYSYVATTNAILWENCTPVFVDISNKDFCIDTKKIEGAITSGTQAILATHVYGLPCNIEEIQTIAGKYDLNVIYDGAHAFGCEYGGQSLLNYGDITICSFHGTKIFHTAEGGCIICRDETLYKKLFLTRSFGHSLDDYYYVGINAKNSELHAAMGLSVLPYVKKNIEKNRLLFYRYLKNLNDPFLQFLVPGEVFSYNYGYFPVVFESEEVLVKVKKKLEEEMIFPRRYFYPSLNTLPFLKDTNDCPVSESISRKVLCLPLYGQLTGDDVDRISSLVLKVIRK
ncbi:MAG: DegT/DnrJ/EryC1/StrS family aminotransferase [Bacteroidetes bacterium]|nr:DegT/DnrJ/EryC1/StrS family aminotransferase [Bacteroidota bacterium]